MSEKKKRAMELILNELERKGVDMTTIKDVQVVHNPNYTKKYGLVLKD